MRVARAAGLAVVPLLLAFAGCDALLTSPSLYGSVDVRVTRRNGTAISGASLVLYTFQRPMAYATSDASGAHRFDNVPEGLYGVGAVPPPGYASASDTTGNAPWDFVDGLEVRGGTSINARLHFLRHGYGVVVAEVTEFGGPPIGQVPVTLRGPAGLQRSGATDGAGRFTFDSVPAGGYSVTAVRPAAYVDAGEAPALVRDGIVVEDGSRETAGFAFIRRPAPSAVRVPGASAPAPRKR